MRYIWLIPLLPGLGALVNGVIGIRAFSRRAAGLLACATMTAALGLSLVAFWQLLALPSDARAYDVVIAQWIPKIPLATHDGFAAFEVPWGFRLDPLSGMMLLVVTGIGTLIHIYSTAYMADEPRAGVARFFCYLNLFCFFMLMLVLGANFLVMFVGWEGVGLCSYLQFGVLSAICLLLFIGATGKSAQIPLYVWLPDAMEGPTPVSALIHAATMVTAGVYMIGRNAVLFGHAPQTLELVAVIGVATAFVAGTIGLVQNDIKRVLAYSTVSQLGYMFLAMGVGAYAAGIFHLYTHAFFKALLFLGSGAVIHALAGEQDLRNMGGLKKYLPITYWTFLIGALAIAGIPLLSGFFSKDEILFRTFTSANPAAKLLWTVGILTSLLTATYMFRLVFLAFHGERRHDTPAAPAHPEEEEPAAHAAAANPAAPHAAGHGHAGHVHDAPPSMTIPLIVLALGSIVAGYVGVPH